MTNTDISHPAKEIDMTINTEEALINLTLKNQGTETDQEATNLTTNEVTGTIATENRTDIEEKEKQIDIVTMINTEEIISDTIRKEDILADHQTDQNTKKQKMHQHRDITTMPDIHQKMTDIQLKMKDIRQEMTGIPPEMISIYPNKVREL